MKFSFQTSGLRRADSENILHWKLAKQYLKTYAENDKKEMEHGIFSSVNGSVDNSISKFVFINLPKFLLKKPPNI